MNIPENLGRVVAQSDIPRGIQSYGPFLDA